MIFDSFLKFLPTTTEDNEIYFNKSKPMLEGKLLKKQS